MTQYRATWRERFNGPDLRTVEVPSADLAEEYALAGWIVERRETGMWREMSPAGTIYRAFEDLRWASSLAWEAYKDAALGLLGRFGKDWRPRG